MSRRLRLTLVASGLAALLAGGCGIPDNSAVVPVGAGPARDQSSGNDVTPTKPSRTDSSDPATFLTNYLTAPAGVYGSAVAAVKSYMAPELATSFKPTPSAITVIRRIGDPLINPGSPVVTFDAELVGTLNDQGILTPAPSLETAKYQISVGTVPGRSGLFVTSVDKQNVLLMDVAALGAFYARRTIYFWNSDGNGLIPDVRYLPLSVPAEQRPTEVLGWLAAGPAPWLQQVAEALQPGTRPIGNVPATTTGTLQVSLTSQALPDGVTPAERQEALRLLELQLRWSLRPELQTALELNIEHQPPQVFTGNDYLASNAAYKETAQLQRFVVYEGQVRRLARSYRSSEPVPALTAATNKNIQMVSYGQSTTRTYVAAVGGDSNGKPALRVGSSATTQPATMQTISLPRPIGRPVWAVSPPVGTADGTVGLVPAGGRLYSYTPDGTGVAAVAWPGGPGGITSVAVAPDARRVALVAGGRLYLATMTNDNGVQLSAPVSIQTLLTQLTAVDWTSESTLVVAGTSAENNRSAIMDVSIDGAAQTNRVRDLGSTPVNYLVASPSSPGNSDDVAAPVAYVLGSAAFDEARPDRIDPKDLAVPVPNARADAPLPTAPAFLG